MQATHAKRKFTTEEKQQLLANLDFEVEHKIHQLESLLDDALAEFRGRHELQISRIPHIVRAISMADFRDKYQDDVTKAARGLQEQKLASTTEAATIDRAAMKRKWVASQDGEEAARLEKGATKGDGGNMMKPAKNPRMMTNMTTPQKKPPFSVGRSIRTPQTQNRINPRAPSPSPAKFHPSHTAATNPTATISQSHPRPPSRTISPTKPRTNHRPPSATTFNPSIPKTPAYPGSSSLHAPRWPRKDETMMSMNGSPLTNPFELGLSWLADGEDGDGYSDDDESGKGRGGNREGKGQGHTRMNSSIIVRHDASFNSSVASSSNGHTQTQPLRPGGHTRSNSHTHISHMSHMSNRPQSALSTHPHSSQHIHPLPRPHSAMAGPVRSTGPGSGYAAAISARVAVPTKDGHMLEFDPLQTSPSALERLEGITDSAKKQAKEDMVKLVQTAVARWKVT